MLIYCCLCSVSLLSLYKFNFRYGLTWIEKYKSTNLYLHGCVVCVLAYSQISIWMDVTPSCSNICFGKGPHACACLYVCIWVTMCRVLCWKTLTIWRCLLLVDILNYCCFSSGAVLLHSSEKIKNQWKRGSCLGNIFFSCHWFVVFSFGKTVNSWQR